jgi:hypothetical protein
MDQIGHRNGVDAWLLVRRTPGISRGQRPSAACRGSAVDPKIEKRERTTTSSSRDPASYRTKVDPHRLAMKIHSASGFVLSLSLYPHCIATSRKPTDSSIMANSCR